MQNSSSHTPPVSGPPRFPNTAEFRNSRLHITGRDPASVLAEAAAARNTTKTKNPFADDSASVLTTSTFASSVSLIKSSLKSKIHSSSSPAAAAAKESKEAKELRKKEEKKERRRREEESGYWKDSKTREYF